MEPFQEGSLIILSLFANLTDECFLFMKRFWFINWRHLKVVRRQSTLLKKNFMALFYGWGSTASRPAPLRAGSLLFSTKSPEIPGTRFIDLGRMKGWVNLGATWCFWTRDTVDWESSVLSTMPLLHKGGFIIAHIRGIYLIWCLINIWKLLLENPQPPPT